MEGEDYDRWEGESDQVPGLSGQAGYVQPMKRRMARERQRISTPCAWRTYGYATREVADAWVCRRATSDRGTADWSMNVDGKE